MVWKVVNSIHLPIQGSNEFYARVLVFGDTIYARGKYKLDETDLLLYWNAILNFYGS